MIAVCCLDKRKHDSECYVSFLPEEIPEEGQIFCNFCFELWEIELWFSVTCLKNCEKL